MHSGTLKITLIVPFSWKRRKKYKISKLNFFCKSWQAIASRTINLVKVGTSSRLKYGALHYSTICFSLNSILQTDVVYLAFRIFSLCFLCKKKSEAINPKGWHETSNNKFFQIKAKKTFIFIFIVRILLAIHKYCFLHNNFLVPGK